MMDEDDDGEASDDEDGDGEDDSGDEFGDDLAHNEEEEGLSDVEDFESREFSFLQVIEWVDWPLAGGSTGSNLAASRITGE